MDQELYRRLSNLKFDDFRRMASDSSLSDHERIGFPDAFRAGMDGTILHDIEQKVRNLRGQGIRVLDIGCGCGSLARASMARFLESGHEVILMDGAEVLEALPSEPRVRKVPAMFPKCPDVLRELAGTCDVVIVYSAFQYVFVEGNPYEFLDEALRLLAPGGELLLGDIPNVSMRKRFLASENGRQFHRQYTKVDEDPEVSFNCVEPGLIDDGVVFGLLLRARMAGFHAYVMPQMGELPMANRREDLLFRRP